MLAIDMFEAWSFMYALFCQHKSWYDPNDLTLVLRRGGCNNPQTVFALVLKNAQQREKLLRVSLSSSFLFILAKKKWIFAYILHAKYQFLNFRGRAHFMTS